MTDKATFVSFLLDETGSMQSIADSTVDGLNSYLEALRGGDAEIVFSLVTFNSTRTQRRWVAEPIENVRSMEQADYQPEASTPLIDASVKIIKATAEAVAHRGDDPNVVVVIQTDGLENVSVEFDHADLAALIKEKTEAGWEFVFLGAGLDAFEAARAAGIHLSASRVMSYGRTRSAEAFSAVADNTKQYAELGDADELAFSAPQRAAAEDEWTDRHLRPGRSKRSAGGSRPAKTRSKGGKTGARQSTTRDYDLSK